MKYSSSKDIDRLVREQVRRGWLFQRGGKHGRLAPPGGRPILTVPTTPGDYRSLLNFRRDLRQVQSKLDGGA